ncbi:MAG: pyridoxamine 5'-phosphate oxidase family protein, partial [Actinobacteria bacterium]|nr:pyridoxamine 5'-phosphate oxidase family protein [Actinomycetota bacterium]
ATVGPDGSPHVVPLWFAWVDGTLFMNTTLGNATVRHAEADPRVAATVDDGEIYDELRGVLVRGRWEAAGDDPRVPLVREAFSQKYFSGNPVPFDAWRDRAWFRVTPTRVTSWDFRKIQEQRLLRAREREAGA